MSGTLAGLTVAQNLLLPTLKPNGKSCSQMKLTLAKVLARQKYKQTFFFNSLPIFVVC